MNDRFEIRCFPGRTRAFFLPGLTNPTNPSHPTADPIGSAFGASGSTATSLRPAIPALARAGNRAGVTVRLTGAPPPSRVTDVGNETKTTDASRTPDPFDLSRFLAAQDPIYPEALSEIRAGRKRTHWMWFVFPQAIGLGTSPTARHYAIRSLAEARAYLAHPVPGHRLRECAESLLRVRGKSASEIFGYPDDMKLRSSMTLFASVAEEDSVFAEVLERYFGGKRDPLTLGFIERDAGPE